MKTIKQIEKDFEVKRCILFIIEEIKLKERMKSIYALRRIKKNKELSFNKSDFEYIKRLEID